MEPPKPENLLCVPDDIRDSLIAYAEAEKRLQENPVIKDLITWKSLGNKILRNEVQKRGHYVGKGNRCTMEIYGCASHSSFINAKQRVADVKK